MFSLGLGEIILIGIVLFVFIKPEELPGIFHKLGQVFRELDKVKNEFKQMSAITPKEDKKNDNKLYSGNDRYYRDPVDSGSDSDHIRRISNSQVRPLSGDCEVRVRKRSERRSRKEGN
jgi:Sec-independent protein translocase protein TatA